MKYDTNEGRYYVRDLATGRVFAVECIHTRSDRDDGDWQNGGIDKSKHRGSLLESESIITPENGFTHITHARNPMDAIQGLLHGAPA